MQFVTADGEEGRLKNEAESDGEKIETRWAKDSGAQRHAHARYRRSKANCRDDEKLSIHRELL